MALLQISEPGESQEPHRHRLAVGIDLGTTHSLVATVRSGVPEVIADEEGRALLPSVVRFHGGGAVEVGEPARAAQADDPANTIVSVKRFMGRGVAEEMSRILGQRFIVVNREGASGVVAMSLTTSLMMGRRTAAAAS